MCGWFAITTTRLNRIEGTLGITFPEVGPRYNISPSQRIPVIREFTDQTHELVKMRWGSSRAGRRSQDPLQHLQHLQHPRRALAEEPAFRGPFRSRRCLIPASGFSGLKTETGRKQSYYLTAADDGGFAFAGLWDEWCGPEERLLSCTIVVGRPTRSSPRSTIGWSSSQRRLMPPGSIREPAWIPCGP